MSKDLRELSKDLRKEQAAFENKKYNEFTDKYASVLDGLLSSISDCSHKLLQIRGCKAERVVIFDETKTYPLFKPKFSLFKGYSQKVVNELKWDDYFNNQVIKLSVSHDTFELLINHSGDTSKYIKARCHVYLFNDLTGNMRVAFSEELVFREVVDKKALLNFMPDEVKTISTTRKGIPEPSVFVIELPNVSY